MRAALSRGIKTNELRRWMAKCLLPSGLASHLASERARLHPSSLASSGLDASTFDAWIAVAAIWGAQRNISEGHSQSPRVDSATTMLPNISSNEEVRDSVQPPKLNASLPSQMATLGNGVRSSSPSARALYTPASTTAQSCQNTATPDALCCADVPPAHASDSITFAHAQEGVQATFA